MTGLRDPRIPEVGVLALPYHRWGPLWMTPHHVMTRLAEYFTVLWLDPPRHWRTGRKTRAKHQGNGTGTGAGPLPPGFQVCDLSAWLPDVYSLKRTKAALARARVRRAWDRLDRAGCRTRVLYLWHPTFESALYAEKHNVSVYHIDDEYSFQPEPPPMSEEECRVISEVDSVIVTAPRLLERKGGVNPNMLRIPEGVDYHLYSTAYPEPLDLRPIPHPRIGYTGVLKRHLDWQLLLTLASTHQEWSFVFVGPERVDESDLGTLKALSSLNNVHLLGFKNVTELARYPQHFDACIMPYRVNGYTENVYPLKLHEYLAGGRPVVGSPIRSLLDFTTVIELAEGAPGWSHALAKSLGEDANSPTAVSGRRDVARKHDWTRIILRIATEICARLGPHYLARLRSSTKEDQSVSPSVGLI